MKISIQNNKKPKQIWYHCIALEKTRMLDLVKFLLFGKQKLQTSLKLKYGSFTWGRYPQSCTARWLVRSAFVKQQEYCICIVFINLYSALSR